MLSLVRCVHFFVVSCVYCVVLGEMYGLISVMNCVDCDFFGKMSGLFSVVVMLTFFSLVRCVDCFLW